MRKIERAAICPILSLWTGGRKLTELPPPPPQHYLLARQLLIIVISLPVMIHGPAPRLRRVPAAATTSRPSSAAPHATATLITDMPADVLRAIVTRSVVHHRQVKCCHHYSSVFFHFV